MHALIHFCYRHGCAHERDAVDAYVAHMKSKHDGHTVEGCGFSIHPQFPFLGASPDGQILCPECGPGILEVKCPHCLTSLSEGEQRADSCLESQEDKFQLKKNHSYYYQVQLQLATTGTPYCDFVVWLSQENMHIERVVPDNAFFLTNVIKAEVFFKSCILPELISKWFTMGKSDTPAITSSSLVCFCQQPQEEGMVKCTSDACTFKYFHLKCLGLMHVPRSKAYLCPNCRKVAMAAKRSLKRAAPNDTSLL